MASALREQYLAREKVRRNEESKTYGEVRQYLHFDRVDKMVLGVGDCRTGTTAWLATMARAGFPAYYQIGKGALRCMQNQEKARFSGKKKYVPEHVDFGERGNIVAAKETIGPQNVVECTYDPLRSYLYNDYDGKGLDPSQLHVVFFARHPVATFNSWIKAIGEESPVKPMKMKEMELNFSLAAYTEKAILEKLRRENISHTLFAQELLVAPPGRTQQEHSAYIVSKILEQAQTPIPWEQAMYAVSGWQEGGVPGNLYPGLNFFKNNIKFAHEPPYNFDGAIAPTLRSDSYKAFPQPTYLRSDSQIFQTTDLLDIYHEDLLPHSIDQLGLEEYESFYLR